jgi:hypothetical protein
VRVRDSYRAHAGHMHPGHTFVPASVETYGHLCRPIMRYLCHRMMGLLSDVASARSRAVTRGLFLAGAHGELSVALVQSYRVMCIVSVRCCSPRLPGGRCCLERTLLNLIERCVLLCVFVVFVCWLQLDIVPLSVVLGALGSLSLISIHIVPSVCYPRPCRLKRLYSDLGCSALNARKQRSWRSMRQDNQRRTHYACT